MHGGGSRSVVGWRGGRARVRVVVEEEEEDVEALLALLRWTNASGRSALMCLMK
jgi:hypothetical protein